MESLSTLIVSSDTYATGCVRNESECVGVRRTRDIPLPPWARPTPVDRFPGSLERVSGFLQEEYKRAFRHEHWHIGVVDAPIETFLEPDAQPEVRWLPLPDRGKFYADPFGISRGGRTEIVFEEYDFHSDMGVISWVRGDGDGHFTRPRVAISLPFHASYPFLIERSGEVFCVPETAQSHEISLYRAVAFPDQWARVGTLVRGVAGVDSTVFERDGMFWLLCTDQDDGPFSKLRIWYAPDLLGPWTAHPANPVKDDWSSARNAGTPFLVDGELYRPSQDCSHTYGGAVVLNRVVALSTKEYREEPVARVGPFRDGRFRHGVHTLSSIGNRTLIDAKRFGFNGTAMARSVRASIAGVWGRVLRRHATARTENAPPN